MTDKDTAFLRSQKKDLLFVQNLNKASYIQKSVACLFIIQDSKKRNNIFYFSPKNISDGFRK